MDQPSPTNQQEETGWATGLSIADQVKAAAEEAVNQSGFVFQEETGLYYDSSTQLYYSAESGLYYNGYTGTWYQYDETTQEYVVHHQVEGFTFEGAVAAHVLNSIESYTNELSKKVDAEIKSQTADGEIFECEPEETELNIVRKSNCEAQRLAERLPPCIRFLVVETSVEKVKSYHFLKVVIVAYIYNSFHRFLLAHYSSFHILVAL